MNKMTLKDVDVKGKRVLVRVDFNVPLDESSAITDDKRIRAALDTVKYIIDNGGKGILMSHLGRPKDAPDDKLRMAPVGKRLGELLGKPVTTMRDTIGTEVEKAVAAMKPGDVVLLENTRFYKEEKKNDPEFSKKLAALGDVYVNDAFGSAHRAHASTVGVTQYIKTNVSGFLMSKEIEYFSRVLESPDRPFFAILGGAKVSDKIPTIENLLPKVDGFIVGGGMAFTFLKVLGERIGDSILDKEGMDVARATLKKVIDAGKPFLLPLDHIIADKFAADAQTKVVPRGCIPSGWQGLDIGPATVEYYKNFLTGVKTIVWNGPLGVFEMEPFAGGTKQLAEFVSTNVQTTVIGGGDTASAVKKFGLSKKMSHVSTGGGASLEMLEGKELPGVAALTDKK